MHTATLGFRLGVMSLMATKPCPPDRNPPGGMCPGQSNGFSSRTPNPSTSAVLRVTRTRPWTKAVAANSPSTTGTDRIPKAFTTSPSQVARATALTGSRPRTDSTPLRISPSVRTLRNKSWSSTPCHHAATSRLQRAPFRTSEMTLVSTSQVTGPRHARYHATFQGQSLREEQKQEGP